MLDETPVAVFMAFLCFLAALGAVQLAAALNAATSAGLVRAIVP